MRTILHAFCWGLIYVARGMEYVRLSLNGLWFDRGWLSKPAMNLRTGELSRNCRILSPWGVRLGALTHPLSSVARALVRLAGKWLPPLEDAGPLARLHPYRIEHRPHGALRRQIESAHSVPAPPAAA